MSLATLLMDRYKRKVSKFTLVPSDGGKFEVSAGSEVLWSKLRTGEFPDEEALAKQIDARIPKA